MVKYNVDNHGDNYLKHLCELKRLIYLESSQIKKDAIWLLHFDHLINHISDIYRLPELMALIHPDFYFYRGQNFSSNLRSFNAPGFRNGILPTTNCMYSKITGVECVFNSFPDMRGLYEADHYWPHSLGGPSILDNRLILCKYHNGMKSNNVYSFDWKSFPSWLERYLIEIRNLKA